MARLLTDTLPPHFGHQVFNELSVTSVDFYDDTEAVLKAVIYDNDTIVTSRNIARCKGRP